MQRGLKYLMWVFDEKGNLCKQPLNELLTDKRYNKVKLVKYY